MSNFVDGSKSSRNLNFNNEVVYVIQYVVISYIKHTSSTDRIWVSHQPPKVGQLRSFFGSVPLPPVWCGPAWDANFRVHKIVIRPLLI